MMKKIYLAAILLCVTFFVASCQKEPKSEDNTKGDSGGALVIDAIANALEMSTKANTAYRYDILWEENDKILVKGQGGSDTFTLQEGAGTTKGTFRQDNSTVSFSGEVEAFYPSTVVDGSRLVWPARQENNQIVPMYCRQSLSGDSGVFSFSSLGAMLQLVFNSTVEDIVLKSIVIKDGRKNMSGPFSVDENGQATITAADGAGITLDLGSGKVLGKGANYFNLAIPAGKYDDVTISFITTDMHVCTMHSSTLPEIARNTVCRVTLTGTGFGDNTLPGEFSVGNGRAVTFSKGNLYWDGDSYEFEANQYDYPVSREGSHIGHFFWSGDPAIARAASYNDPGRGEHDVFFTNATEEIASPDFTVGGITGRFRTLSMNEWKYLLFNRTNAESLHKVHVTVCGNEGCLVIAPDGFSGVIKNSYDVMDWPLAEAAGLVCLPMAGYSTYSGSPDSGFGYYWSSAPWTSTGAQHIVFLNETNDVSVIGLEYIRYKGCAVRLVRDKEFVTGVSLDRTALDLSLRQSVKLTANVLPADAPVKNVIWKSDNPGVATVSADGTVSGVAVGTATITVTSENAFKTASCAVTVQPQLAGEFSVGSAKKVRFSPGNLFWNGDSYEFEANQYDYPVSRATSHMGHFFWSNDPSVARAASYHDSGRGEHDVFFTNATEETAGPDFTVGGITGKFRTLSMNEWKYLFDGRSRADVLHKIHVTVCGKENCLIIAPDNFAGEIKTSYSAEEWPAAETAGLVCIPPAGYSLSGGNPSGNVGYYWSSAPWTIGGAQYVGYTDKTTDVVFLGSEYTRGYCCAVRLVSDVVAK